MRTLPKHIAFEFDRSNSDYEYVLTLLVEHPQLDGGLRFHIDTEFLLLNGFEWQAIQPQIQMPSSTSGEPSRGKFTFPNLDRRAIALLQNVVNPATVRMDFYDGDDFDLNSIPRAPKEGVTPVPFRRIPPQQLVNAVTSDLAVSVEMAGPNLRVETYPRLRATKKRMPGLFV